MIKHMIQKDKCESLFKTINDRNLEDNLMKDVDIKKQVKTNFDLKLKQLKAQKIQFYLDLGVLSGIQYVKAMIDKY